MLFHGFYNIQPPCYAHQSPALGWPLSPSLTSSKTLSCTHVNQPYWPFFSSLDTPYLFPLCSGSSFCLECSPPTCSLPQVSALLSPPQRGLLGPSSLKKLPPCHSLSHCRVEILHILLLTYLFAPLSHCKIHVLRTDISPILFSTAGNNA